MEPRQLVGLRGFSSVGDGESTSLQHLTSQGLCWERKCIKDLGCGGVGKKRAAEPGSTREHNAKRSGLFVVCGKTDAKCLPCVEKS